MSLNIYMMDVPMLKARTAIHTNIDAKLIYPTIKVCQDMFIHPLLGSSLYNKFIVLIDNVTGVNGIQDASNADYKTLLNDYIIDPLCWYTLSKAIFDVTYQMWNKGVVKKQGDSTDLLGTDELEAMRNEYKNRAEWYGERLRAYLRSDNGVKFPEYLITQVNCNDIAPENKAFTIPVYLGGDEDCNCLHKFVP